MNPAQFVAWALVLSVVYIAWCVVRFVVARRRVLPPPTKEATRYSRPDAAP